MENKFANHERTFVLQGLKLTLYSDGKVLTTELLVFDCILKVFSMCVKIANEILVYLEQAQVLGLESHRTCFA